MPTYTFRCPNGHEFDRRTDRLVTGSLCECSAVAERQSVYAVNFGGFAKTPRDQRTYYQEFKDFQEASAELEYAHGRMEEAAGKELAPPPLARTARKEAQRLIGLGVESSEDYRERQKH